MNDERKTTIEVNMTDDEWIELLCLCEEINLTPEDLAVAFCQEVIRQQVDSMELRYVKELTAKREKDPTALRVSREEPVFQKIGLKAKVDLFVDYIDRVTIYEAKAGKSKALDLYQLRMYVDGCALDNKPVDEAVLIAKRHSAEVKELRDILNTLTAPDGHPYNFRLTTWDEDGIVIRQSA